MEEISIKKKEEEDIPSFLPSSTLLPSPGTKGDEINEVIHNKEVMHLDAVVPFSIETNKKSKSQSPKKMSLPKSLPNSDRNSYFILYFMYTIYALIYCSSAKEFTDVGLQHGVLSRCVFPMLHINALIPIPVQLLRAPHQSHDLLRLSFESECLLSSFESLP